MKLRPSEVLFTTDHIPDPSNHDDAPTRLSLTEELENVQNESKSMEKLPPLPVFSYDGQFWSLENRQLWILQQLQNECRDDDVHVSVYTIPAPENFVEPPKYHGRKVDVISSIYGINNLIGWKDNDNSETAPIGWNVNNDSTGGHESLGKADEEIPKEVNPLDNSLRQRYETAGDRDLQLGDISDADDKHFLHSVESNRFAKPTSIDNSAFESFCNKAAVVYIIIIIILVLTYGR